MHRQYIYIYIYVKLIPEVSSAGPMLCLTNGIFPKVSQDLQSLCIFCIFQPTAFSGRKVRQALLLYVLLVLVYTSELE